MPGTLCNLKELQVALVCSRYSREQLSHCMRNCCRTTLPTQQECLLEHCHFDAAVTAASVSWEKGGIGTGPTQRDSTACQCFICTKLPVLLMGPFLICTMFTQRLSSCAVRHTAKTKQNTVASLLHVICLPDC